jgi:hypothetical protein
MVHYFALASGINIKKRLVNIQDGEQRQKQYLQVNPNGKVPAIDDDGYMVNEVCRACSTARIWPSRLIVCMTVVELCHHSLSGKQVQFVPVSNRHRPRCANED